MDTAVLLLVFNRPDTTELVMKALQQYRPSRLYVAADGPRKSVSGETDLCEATREVVLKNVDWKCNVITLFRDQNLGCARAVSQAIDWFFENEEMGIILEDDCLPDPSFFGFCGEMLAYYADDRRVMHISGYNDQLVHSSASSYYFSYYPRIWGWATWRRAWKHYQLVPDVSSELQSIIISKYFYGLKKAGERWFHDFRKSSERLTTWDYQWCLAIWKQHGLSVNSSVPLIKNIGFDARGSHTTEASKEVAMVRLQKYSGPVTHPAVMLSNAEADMISVKQNLRPDFRNRAMLKLRSLTKSLSRK